MGPRASSFRAITRSIYGAVRLQEALTNAVEDELNDQGRESDVEDAGEDSSGLANERSSARRRFGRDLDAVRIKILCVRSLL